MGDGYPGSKFITPFSSSSTVVWREGAVAIVVANTIHISPRTCPLGSTPTSLGAKSHQSTQLWWVPGRAKAKYVYVRAPIKCLQLVHRRPSGASESWKMCEKLWCVNDMAWWLGHNCAVPWASLRPEKWTINIATFTFYLFSMERVRNLMWNLNCVYKNDLPKFLTTNFMDTF